MPPRAVLRRPSALAVLALAACAGKDAPSLSTTTDSAGVTIVTGPAADVPLPWTLTEVRRLGGADTGALAFTDASAHTVATDGRSRIVVIDWTGQQRVHVFDSTGTLLRSLGRKGGGPGEMQWPNGLSVGRDGAVSVFDIEKTALVRWDAAGALLPEVKWSMDRGFPWSTPIALGDSVFVLMQNADSLHQTYRLERRTPRDTVTLDSVARPKPTMTMFTCVGMTLPPLFTGQMGWALGDGAVATTRQTEYVVDLREGTALRRSVRRAIVPAAATEADAGRLYPEGLKVKFGGGRECVTPVSEVVAKVGIAPTVPLVQSVRFGPDGALWVERYRFKNDPPSVDVFDRAGNYLGTLAGKPLPLGFLGDDLVLFPIEDEATGSTVIGIYRIAPVRG